MFVVCYQRFWRVRRRSTRSWRDRSTTRRSISTRLAPAWTTSRTRERPLVSLFKTSVACLALKKQYKKLYFVQYIKVSFVLLYIFLVKLDETNDIYMAVDMTSFNTAAVFA